MSIASFLDVDGPLATEWPDFHVRPGQQRLATAIESALQESGLCCIEAGTGLGKTIAYLLPVILSGQRVLVSTATKVLQAQIVQKDIPLLREILDVPIQVRVLKGRHNYLCLQALENYTFAESGASASIRSYQTIRLWAQKTQTGELSEWPDLPDRAYWETQFGARIETCTNSQCPDYARCFLFRSRQEAARADVVIVNHHLFVHEYIRHEETQHLPDIDAVIFDEAHHLPMVLRQCLGHRVSVTGLVSLCTQMRHSLSTIDDTVILSEALTRLLYAIQDWRVLYPPMSPPMICQASAVPKEHRLACDVVRDAVAVLLSHLAAQAARHVVLGVWLRTWTEIHTALSAFLVDPAFVHRLHGMSTGIHLLSLPVMIDQYLPKVVERSGAALIFLSATLSVDDSLHFFIQQLGLEPTEVTTDRIDTPFLYEEQGMLVIPRDMPEPTIPSYLTTMCEMAAALITASEGGAVFLCSSVRHVHSLTTSLREALPPEYTVLSAESAFLGPLVTQFQSTHKAVLIGAQALWEGIDIPGPALRLLLIDKIPFAAPDDPVVEAERLKNPDTVFRDYQLPMAILHLKQGIGRLIRSVTDEGVVTIFDRRLLSKSYGRLIRENLPPFRTSHCVKQAQEYLMLLAKRLNSGLHSR